MSKTKLGPDTLYRQVFASIYVILAGESINDLESGTNLSQGSAVAITAKHLLTNCHIIENSQIIILLQGDKTQLAKLSSADMQGDRCILLVEDPVTPIHFVRKFSDLVVGERVYSIGSPSGLDRTLAEGLISGLRRHKGLNYIQTSSPVSSGSSGGGLFDSFGNLVGITTFILRDAQNLNFTIAIEEFLVE